MLRLVTGKEMHKFWHVLFQSVLHPLIKQTTVLRQLLCIVCLAVDALQTSVVVLQTTVTGTEEIQTYVVRERMKPIILGGGKLVEKTCLKSY